MNLNKSLDFFKPSLLNNDRIHIIGCGAIGSTLAENLVRFGIKNITLYDFDIVEPHNIANQIFRCSDVGKSKVEALYDILFDINPEISQSVKLEKEGYKNQKLTGYVFLCVDNIELRKEIATKCKGNFLIKAMFDFRMRLTDAQHYAAEWKNFKSVQNFINSMNFTHDEAKEGTPVSACNLTLSVVPTVRIIVAYGVSNFINFVKEGKLKNLILIDAFNYMLDVF